MTNRFVTVPDSLELPPAVKVGVGRLHDSTVAGRALLTGADAAAQRSSLGLGTAAAADAGDFATAAQGALADTAVQPEDLGTAAAADAGDFATAAQGAKADASDVDQITLTGDLVLTLPVGHPAGQVYRAAITQDGVGGHTVTYGGTPLDIDMAAGATTRVAFAPKPGGGFDVLPRKADAVDTRLYVAPRLPLNAGVFTTHGGIYAAYDALMAAHPGYITSSVLGTDALGNEIRQYRLNHPVTSNSFGIAKPIVGITSGIHGNEKGPVAALLAYLTDIVSGGTSHAPSRTLISQVDLRVVPCVNPSGYDLNTRHNANDVNLNRNFTSYWTSAEAGAGAGPASEPETQIIEAWMAAGLDYFFDYHWSDQVGTTITWAVVPVGSPDEMEMRCAYADAMQLLSAHWSARDPRFPAGTNFANLSAYGNLAQTQAHAGKIGIRSILIETAAPVTYVDTNTHGSDTSRCATEVIGNTLTGVLRPVLSGTDAPTWKRPTTDTRWRDISSLLTMDSELSTTAGRLHIRRIGQVVMLRARLQPVVAKVGTVRTTRLNVCAIPAGFRPDIAFAALGDSIISAANAMGQVHNFGSKDTLSLNLYVASGNWASADIVTINGAWTTADAFPAINIFPEVP